MSVLRLPGGLCCGQAAIQHATGSSLEELGHAPQREDGREEIVAALEVEEERDAVAPPQLALLQRAERSTTPPPRS